jgi:TetR/AcrR family fatty acid metabolism transcriptional regulator
MRDREKSQQIIDAAIRVFARNGYYNSRVSDIAREAGVASGTIYLYFRTKDDILVTLFREKMAQWLEFLRKAIAEEPDAVAKLRRLIALHFEILQDHPDLAEVVQVELRQGQKFLRGEAAHEITGYLALIGSVLEEGMAAGLIRLRLPVKVATKMLFGAMDQMATSWVLGKRGYRLTDTADAVADIFLKGAASSGEGTGRERRRDESVAAGAREEPAAAREEAGVVRRKPAETGEEPAMRKGRAKHGV